MENSQETGRGVRESLQASSIDSNHHLPKNYFTDKKYYQYLAMIGKGGFGKVWRVKHLPTNKIYALKEMSKATYVI